MEGFRLIQDSVVFILLYIPPLILFSTLWVKKGRNKIELSFIWILYLIFSIMTQNFLPFMISLFCIKLLKGSDEFYEDYYRYKFNFKGFKIIKAFGFAIASYFITTITALIALNLFSLYKVPIKDQEITTVLVNYPLNKFIIMIPVLVIFAPVLEEFIFRWLFFEKIFKNRIGIYLSAVLSSILFAVGHFNIKAAPVLLILGMINCYFIHKKGYWYAVFNHCFFNSITTTVLLLQKLNVISV